MSEVQVTNDELQVLNALNKKKATSLSDIEKKSKFPRAKILFHLNELEKKKFVKVKEVSVESAQLTGLGEEILANGLPEEVIFNKLVEVKKLPMKDVFSLKGVDKKGVNAAIGRLKKQGIVNIVKGNLELLKEELPPEIMAIKDALRAVKKGKALTKEQKELLRSRGLVEFTSKTDYLAELKLSPSKLEKAVIVEEVSELTMDDLATGAWRKKRFKRYNLGAKPRRMNFGRPQPYKEFLEELKTTLIGLGFQEMRGPIIETEFWNFDALFSPQNHPAREDSDILLLNHPTHGKLPKANYVDNVKKTHENGWNIGSKGWRYRWDPKKAARLLLRPQGTAISARTLSTLKPPAKYFSISRCYRPDVIDATHAIEFDQTEGIVAAEDLTFKDLLGILETFAIEVAGAEKVYFRPDYYPFTSPSVEMGAVHPTLGKIEFGGAGIFRPEVTKPFGLDVPVLAWGLGIGRLYMVKHNIKDIRELFTQDLNWLRNEPMI